MEVTVDTREPKCFLNAVEDALEGKDVKVSSGTLRAGDVEVSHSESGRAILIERKTATDLRSSMLDGRWEVQRDKMRSYVSEGDTGSVRAFFYVVENNGELFGDARTCGAMLSLVARHGVSCIVTSGATETASLVRSAVLRMEKDPSWPDAKPSCGAPLEPVPKREKGESFAETVLRCVKGLGPKAARAIASSVDHSLLRMVELAYSEGAVESIGCILSGGRRIGEAKARSMVGALTCSGRI